MTFKSSFHKSNHYKVSITVSAILLCLGFFLQCFLGSIPKEWFTFPFNLYIGISFIIITTTLFLFFKQKDWVNLLSSVPFALCMIVVTGVLTIGLGSFNLKPLPIEMQKPGNEFLYKMGLDNITATWYFGFFYLGLLINLWFAILKRSLIYQRKNITFLLNHFGLWLILFSGVLGQGDILRLKMTLQNDIPEWRGVDDKGHVIELPIALELKKFKMDIYPNKIFVIDEKGESLPKAKPEGFLLEKPNTVHQFDKWEVTLLEYIENAVPTGEKKYSKNPMWGSTNAAKISIRDKETGKKKIEWISSGNFQLPPKAVSLSKNRTLVMAPPEAKKFESELLVYQKESDKIEKHSIYVNQPLSVDGWKIYQTSYDEKMGRWSDISIVELVHDPWLPLVYLGIFILMAGTFSFLIKNSKP
ncbi:cytochrome c biogenesis protein ResB [Chryseobacterium aurantiacum]|uniref:cytochrome c biogenesis protein ResB n=1 Tax=Chryseobacterium aurantiacum TaxID=2116499 RepID=UPI000D13D3D8|nr:cytochrome c biogenesis protein ResB [Chryseobacterium aurantiacum]